MVLHRHSLYFGSLPIQNSKNSFDPSRRMIKILIRCNLQVCFQIYLLTYMNHLFLLEIFLYFFYSKFFSKESLFFDGLIFLFKLYLIQATTNKNLFFQMNLLTNFFQYRIF